MPTIKIVLDHAWGEARHPDPAPPPGVTMEGPTYRAQGTWKKGLGGTQAVIVSFILSIPAGVAANLITGCIKKLFSNHGEKRIKMQEEEIELDEGEIRRIVTRTLEIHD
jgi:hypothetical protein